MNDAMSEAPAAAPRPAAVWHELTNAFDVVNLGRTTAEIGPPDLALDRRVPILATRGVHTAGNRPARSIRDLEIRSTGGGFAVVSPDLPAELYRNVRLDRTRHVARVQSVFLPLLDLLANLSTRVPNRSIVSPYPVFRVDDALVRDRRRLTTLAPGAAGLVPGFQFDVSVTLAIAEAGLGRNAFHVPPLVLNDSRSLGVDGMFCSVARIDPINLHAFPQRRNDLAPAWGVVAGNLPRVVSADSSRLETFAAGGMSFVPFGATLRTMSSGVGGQLAGVGAQDDSVSVLDGLDLANLNFAAGAERDENREIGARASMRLSDANIRIPTYPQRRVRFTLSFATPPSNVLRWDWAGNATVPDFANASLIVQASAIWLETQRERGPGEATAVEGVRWRAQLMRTPEYLNLTTPRRPVGWSLVDTVEPNEDEAVRLVGEAFDFGIVLGAFSSFGDAARGVRVRVEDVFARLSIVSPIDGNPLWLRSGIPSDSLDGAASIVRNAFGLEIVRGDQG